MDIILKKEVENLGEKDELVNVKPGYARNFLIPRGMAVPATPSNKKVLNETLKQREHKEEKVRKEAQEAAEKLKNETIQIGAKVGEEGKIFGSVNPIQLADKIKQTGFPVDRKNIKIYGDPIKSTGKYEAEIKFHRDVVEVIEFEVVSE